MPRRRLKRPSTVWMRWLPHTATGTQRHPAPRRDSSRPGRNGRSSHEREIVASGKIPTTSPARTRATAWRRATSTVRAVDGDVAHGPHGTADDRWGEDAVLGEEPHEAAPPAPDEPDEEEVEEADVVAGEDGAALSREVLRAAHVDAQPEDREDGEGGADDEAVGPVGHTSSSFPRARRLATLEADRSSAERDRSPGYWSVAMRPASLRPLQRELACV